MSSVAKMHFVEQQGFGRMEGIESERQYAALMFQPRVVGVTVAIGLITQSPALFLALSALLWWNAILPAWNPFDAVYNERIAGPRGLPRLGPAPVPRRFAQGMAATFMLGIGLALLAGAVVLAWILEGFLVAAMLALVVGRFCLGSYIYHLISGRSSFANETLPWRRV